MIEYGRPARLLTFLSAIVMLISQVCAAVTNGSFESPQIAPNTFVTRPEDVPGWTFLGNSGLANGNTQWCTGAQEGSQYVFLRSAGNPGSITQIITNLVPGESYRLVFWMRRRTFQNYALVNVFLDDSTELLSQTNPLNVNWTAFATEYFTATSPSHKITVVAQQTGADVATVLDNITLQTGPPPIGLPLNGSFETPVLDSGNWSYGLTALDIGWVFDTKTGIANGQNAWGSTGQEGSQYAFLQMDGSFSQTIGYMTPGTSYHARWYMMPRIGSQANPVQVYVNNTVVFPFTVYETPSWRQFASNPFYAASPTANLRFKGGPNIGDRTELIDSVKVYPNLQANPEGYQLIRGFHASGNLDSLYTIDQNYLVVQRGITFNANEAPIQLVVTSHSPVPSPIYLNFRLISGASLSGLSQKVEAFNYQTQIWDIFSDGTLPMSDHNLSVTKLGNATQYVHSTTQEMKVRIIVKPTGPITSTQWTVRFDYLHWAISNQQ